MKAIKRLFWIVFNAIQLAFTLSWSVVLISIGVLLALIGLKPVTHWLARFVWAPGLVYGAGGRIRVHGQLPNNGPFFLVMNHQSVIDIPVAMMVFKVPVHFIVKKELAKVPFLGWYIWAM
ncbi:MAG: 1-acyl-sn-glycerol-3-phosphate acyltransferase, partial [Acidobacteria bacterium]|nr:1-acyl-sn-glycerol-3-phosphate acyltransferase [Acidobacteriota bacterium]